MDRFARFTWLVLGYNVLVVLWGAVVRATGSGAGCGSHWPLCNGEVLPRAETAATLIELSHRLTSGLALLLVVALVVLAVRSRPTGHPARGTATAALVLMLAEAGIGASLVLFELVADNRSFARGLFMATHLVNTFLLLGALTLTGWHASGGERLRLRGHGARAAAFGLAGALVLIVSASGAIAALGDTLFPAASLTEALAAELKPASHALIRLRVLHPFLAVGMAIVVGALAWPLASADRKGSARFARAVLTVVLVQTAAGAINVLLLAPVWLQVVHLLLADALWIALVLLAASVLATAPDPMHEAVTSPRTAEVSHP